MNVPLQRVSNAVVLLLVLGLNACATGQSRKIEHGFIVQNEGNTPIYDVQINYGAIKLDFCKPHCLAHRGGGGWFAPMSIQPEMQVSWRTEGGRTHEVRVPVLSKVKDMNRFARLFLKFNGGNLLVEQGSFLSDPGLVGWEMSPLYP